jgi:hypothetical protein
MPLERKPDGKVKKDEYDGRRSEHVVFVPWEGADAQEWVDKTNQWNSVKAQWNVVGDGQVVQEGHFEIITYDHAIPHHPTLARIGGDPRAVIYIRGHGNPGEEYIQVKMLGTENTKKLPIIDACQRLIDMGLPSSVSEKPLFACANRNIRPTIYRSATTYSVQNSISDTLLVCTRASSSSTRATVEPS